MKTLKNFLIAGMLLAFFAACNNDDSIDDFAQPGPAFNMDLFEQNVQDALYPEAVGLSYAISQNGQLKRTGANGMAKTGPDGNQNMTVHTRINVASISKLISTVAALKIIDEDNSIDLDDAIGPYLPVSWEPSPEFEAITFRQLMRHESGLHVPASDDGYNEQVYSNLQKIAKTEPIGGKFYDYCNINFALFRVLIPHMLGEVELSSEISNAVIYATYYENYIQDEILEPIGINGASLEQEANDALLYRFPYDNSSGVNPGNWELQSGAGGWYMSAFQLANFTAYVWHSETLISKGMRAKLNSSILGLSETVFDGEHGKYQAKGGGLRYSDPAKGVDCMVMNYPNGVQVAVISNSTGPGTFPLNPILRDAFDDAWQ